jgi:hypothetical protein
LKAVKPFVCREGAAIQEVPISFNVCGIPMALIPHSQGPWLEGINPVTNLQWQNGVEPWFPQKKKKSVQGRLLRSV